MPNTSTTSRIVSQPAELRRLIRAGTFNRQTSGQTPGYAQGNIAILTKDYAGEFLRFCLANPKPCPILAMSEPGDPRLPRLGADLDIRTDISRYCVFRDGEAAGEVDDLMALWRDDFVTFVLGCSFSFEQALIEAGLKPVCVDVAAFAMENMYTLNYDVGAEPVALVNVGASTVNINVLRRGVSAFTRDLQIGGRNYTEEIQRSLNVSFEEAEAFKVGGAERDRSAVVPEEVERVLSNVSENIAGEVHRSLDFYLSTAGGGTLGRVVLTGGACVTPGLRPSLEARCGCTVEIADPFKRVQVDERAINPNFLQNLAPQAAIAVGLGLRRAEDK